MYRVLLTVTGLCLPPSEHHFVMPPTWCQLATVCNHTGIPECAQQNDSNFKIFLDECDMFEYNCDNLKEYIKVEMMNCPNISTTLTATNASVTLAITTVATPSNPPFATIHNTTSQSSVTTVLDVTELEKNSSTPQLDVSLSTIALASTINRNLITPLQSTSPTIKNCTRSKNQTPTIQNEATTEKRSSTTPSPVTYASSVTLLQTTTNSKQLNLTLSTKKVECTRYKNTSSAFDSTESATKTTVIISTFPSSTPALTSSTARSNTVSTQLITPVNNTTMNCTRNIKQNLTAEIQTSTPLISTPFTSTTITKPSLIFSSSISRECSRHKKLTSPITIKINTNSSLSPSKSTSTKSISESTSLKTAFSNQTESITDMKTNCTRNQNHTYIITKITPLPNNSHTSSTNQVTEPITATNVSNSTNVYETIIATTVEYEEEDPNETNKETGKDDGNQTDVTLNVMKPTLIECEKYAKNCKRPSTWETTAQGETRDFFQILRAKFGTRVRLLRATTHWPIKAPFFINDGTFRFGRNNDS